MSVSERGRLWKMKNLNRKKNEQFQRNEIIRREQESHCDGFYEKKFMNVD